jgi:putative Mg2+ transporter-C (MgtC) family protein
LFPQTGGVVTIDAGEQWAIIGRIALAGALGAVIGLEREYRGYPAGVRTMALVCLGSTLFADVSRLFGGNDRIAAQVVTGIGFLGAGLMFRSGLGVKGVTTAATIWATAAVGMAVGIEAYIVAVAAAAMTVVLLELRIFTRLIDAVPFAEEDEGQSGDGAYEAEAKVEAKADS